MLCRYMINAGLGVPHEYFNPINMRRIAPRLGLGESAARLDWRARSPWDRIPLTRAAQGRAAEVDFLSNYIPAIVPRRCQGGIFAAKIHFGDFLKVLDNPVGFRLLDGGLFIHLYREDMLAQAVSIHFANLTGRWDIDETVVTAPAAKPDFFDVAAIDRTLGELAEQGRGWRLFLARNGLSPLSVSYERLCEDPYGIVMAIARRLGIDPATVRRDYSEAGASSEDDPALPRKREVVRRYLAVIRQLQGPAAPPPLHPPANRDAALREAGE